MGVQRSLLIDIFAEPRPLSASVTGDDPAPPQRHRTRQCLCLSQRFRGEGGGASIRAGYLEGLVLPWGGEEDVSGLAIFLCLNGASVSGVGEGSVLLPHH